ncbi:MAG: hypothetical protein ACE5Z5_01530 [Candidatus Bathyarchaeia archaeon]
MADIYDRLGVPFNIDEIPQEVGKRLSEGLAIQVRGACRVVYGDGRCLRESTTRPYRILPSGWS